MLPASLSTTLLVVASAVLHAGWNAALKREADKPVACAAIMVACVASGALVALLGWGLGGASPFAGSRGLLPTLVAGACEAGYLATLVRALERSPLGPAYAIARGGSLLLVWPFSVLLLGEYPVFTAVGGALLVLCGLAVLGAERGPVRDGLGWALACAACIAGYHLAYKSALGAGASPPWVFTLSLSIALAGNLALLPRGGTAAVLRALRSRAAVLTLAGVAAAASFLLMLVALREAGAGYVLTLRHASVVFGLLFAWGLGERPTPRIVAGVLLVAAGAVLTGWPVDLSEPEAGALPAAAPGAMLAPRP